MIMPAFCNKCKSIIPSGIEISDSSDITLSGNRVGCNVCGGIADVVDGTFNIIGSAVEVIKNSSIEIEDLKVFLRYLNENKDIDVEDLNNCINDRIPALKNILDILPSDKNQWYAFIGIMLVVVQIIIQLNTSTGDTKNINVNEIHQHFYEFNTNTYIENIQEP